MNHTRINDLPVTGPLAGVRILDMTSVVMGRTRRRSSATTAPT